MYFYNYIMDNLQLVIIVLLVLFLLYSNRSESFRMFNSGATLSNTDIQDLYTGSDAERLGYQYHPVTRDHDYYDWFNPTRTANYYPSHMNNSEQYPSFYIHNGIYHPRYWQRAFMQTI